MHGQPRFINNPFALRSHQIQIFEKYNCDVYCHTWYGGNFSGSASSWSGIPNVEISQFCLEIIRTKLNPKIFEVDLPKEFSLSKNLEEKLLAKFSGQEGWTKKNISNVMSSLYSIEKVVKIAKTLDLSTYDFIILSRYDNLIYRLPDLNLLDKSKFYISDHHPKFPDLLFIFSPIYLETFQIYSKIEELITENFHTIWGPSMNEPLKMFSFLSKYNLDSDCRAISLPVRVVRDENCRGDLTMLEVYKLSPKEFLINWGSTKDVITYLKISIKFFLKSVTNLSPLIDLINFIKKGRNWLKQLI